MRPVGARADPLEHILLRVSVKVPRPLARADFKAKRHQLRGSHCTSLECCKHPNAIRVSAVLRLAAATGGGSGGSTSQ